MSSPAAALPSAASRAVVAFRVVGSVFRDVRVRHGIKVGSAATLALWITQILRLEHPNWAVLATLVLANTYYVGAVASRAVMRSLGTVCGALIGVWAVGDFGNDPARFVVIVFVVVTAATYFYGQLATSAWPYAYYLVGLTLTAVATYGIADPANIWRNALQRVLETLVAVFCATFISAVVWPRDASEEFTMAAAEALQTVRAVLLAQARAEADRGKTDAALDGLILRLRTLVVTGGRGSIRFRANLGSFQRFLVTLSHLRYANLEMADFAGEGGVGEALREEFEAVVSALDHDLAELAERMAAAADGDAPEARLEAAYLRLEAGIGRIAVPLGACRISLAEQEAVYGHLAAWRQVRDELRKLRDFVSRLVNGHLPPLPLLPAEDRAAVFDRAWGRISLKAGVSVCLAFLLLRWVHPPGANAVPVAAFLFSVSGRYSMVAGGRGDLRILQTVFLNFLLGWPVVGLCWLLLPALTDYWAMNTALFALCFGLSFTMARAPLFTYGRLVVLLGISTLVALDPNQPVTFQALVDAYVGLMVGVGLGALVARVLWPVLPQGLLRAHMIRFFEELRRFPAGAWDEAYILHQTVMLPVEAMQAAHRMVLPRCAAGEREKLVGFIRSVQPLGWQLASLGVATGDVSGGEADEHLSISLLRLSSGIDQFLAGLAKGFRRWGARPELPDLSALLADVEKAWVKSWGDGPPGEKSAATLELLHRCRVAVGCLQDCGQRFSALSLPRYLGDVAL